MANEENTSYLKISDATRQIIRESIPVILGEGREGTNFSLDDFVTDVYACEEVYRTQREEADDLISVINGSNRDLAELVLDALPKDTRQKVKDAYMRGQGSDALLNHNMAWILKEAMWRANILLDGEVNKHGTYSWRALKLCLSLDSDPAMIESKLSRLTETYESAKETARKNTCSQASGKVEAGTCVNSETLFSQNLDDLLQKELAKDAKLYAVSKKLVQQIALNLDQNIKPTYHSTWIFDVFTRIAHYLDAASRNFTFLSSGINLDSANAYSVTIRLLKTLTASKDLSDCSNLDSVRISCGKCEQELNKKCSEYPDLKAIGTPTDQQTIQNPLHQFVFAYRLFKTLNWHELGKAMLENMAGDGPFAHYILRPQSRRIEVYEFSADRCSSPFVKYALEKLPTSHVDNLRPYRYHPASYGDIILSTIRSCEQASHERSIHINLHHVSDGTVWQLERNIEQDRADLIRYLSSPPCAEDVPKAYFTEFNASNASHRICCVDNHVFSQVDIPHTDLVLRN